MQKTNIEIEVTLPNGDVETEVYNTAEALFYKYGNIKSMFSRLASGETWHLVNDTMMPPFRAGSKVRFK